MGDEKGLKKGVSVKQEQIQDIIFSREIGWQEIIYDLINTEQLDPWDINITLLTEKYLIKIKELEEMDFFVSSKVLLAAALLLRIKSEILVNNYIKSIDEILFGKKEEKKYSLERIELDEEIPALVPRSPIPRFKKVTLKELIESLNKAITTENRRIKKEIVNKNALRESSFSLPKKRFNIGEKITQIFNNLTSRLSKTKTEKISFTDLVGEDKEEKIFSFSPLLHLENQQKVWLEQENHFEEIFVWLKDVYFKKKGDPFAEIRKELESQIEQDARKDEKIKKRLIKTKKEFRNPIGE